MLTAEITCRSNREHGAEQQVLNFQTVELTLYGFVSVTTCHLNHAELYKAVCDSG